MRSSTFERRAGEGRRRFLVAGLLLLAPAAMAVPPPKVALPLAEYLALVERAEARDKVNAAIAGRRESPVAEVVEEHLSLRLYEREARLESTFEVLLQGEPLKPVWLPLAGFGDTATIERETAGGAFTAAAGASLASGGPGRGATLVATERGRYRVRAQSRLPAGTGGRIELRLLAVAAPVASVEVDLPAELEWSSPGAVLVADEALGGRRQLRLATQRGSVPVFQAWRRFEQGDEKALAHTVVLTLLQLRPEGLRRHDVVLYEVSRGRLLSFEVKLPPGLEIEQAATDEGPVAAAAEGSRLRVERRRQLQGTGYLVLSSTPAAAGELAVGLVEPAVEARARFLAVASSVVAEIGPRPMASFTQVDLSDLPPLLGQALGAVPLTAAWRLLETEDPLALRLAPLPEAAMVATTVVRRDTTTLLTVDGTLLHREVFALAATDRPASSFEVELPPRAILWSTKVDGQPTRALLRAGKLVLPILPQPGAGTEVEVVSVLEQAIPPGRSQLGIELAQTVAPVLEHNWRLLLPDGPQYRFAGGDLQPASARRSAENSARRRKAPAPVAVAPTGLHTRGSAGILGMVMVKDGDQFGLPGVTVTLTGPAGTLVTVTDSGGWFRFEGLPAGTYETLTELEGFASGNSQVSLHRSQNKTIQLSMSVGIEEQITITSESPLLDTRAIDRAEKIALDESRLAAEAYREQVGQLQQGLVGGVKPLPITIPESGKSLVLSGVLPPERVSVTIDVKAKK